MLNTIICPFRMRKNAIFEHASKMFFWVISSCFSSDNVSSLIMWQILLFMWCLLHPVNFLGMWWITRPSSVLVVKGRILVEFFSFVLGLSPQEGVFSPAIHSLIVLISHLSLLQVLLFFLSWIIHTSFGLWYYLCEFNLFYFAHCLLDHSNYRHILELHLLMRKRKSFGFDLRKQTLMVSDEKEEIVSVW